MNKYDFTEQSNLFEDAVSMLKEYNIENWSFGGGTALSYCYYNHRMSYDIDIFTEDRSSVQRLIDCKEAICDSFGIPRENTEVSNSGITFILFDEEHEIKLDFVERYSLTNNPMLIKTVFGIENINVQTPLEIIAKKMKHRTNITIRDFVDFAIAEKEDNIITKIKSEHILDLERFIDIYEQFVSLSETDFNTHLKYLLPEFMTEKRDIEQIMYSSFNPKESFSIAVDDNFEVWAVDEWVDLYEKGLLDARKIYIKYYDLNKTELANLLKLEPNEITYSTILNLNKNIVETITKKERHLNKILSNYEKTLESTPTLKESIKIVEEHQKVLKPEIKRDR